MASLSSHHKQRSQAVDNVQVLVHSVLWLDLRTGTQSVTLLRFQPASQVCKGAESTPGTVLAFYNWITDWWKFSDLKQHPFISLYSLYVRSSLYQGQSLCWWFPALGVTGWNQGVCTLIVCLHLEAPGEGTPSCSLVGSSQFLGGMGLRSLFPG